MSEIADDIALDPKLKAMLELEQPDDKNYVYCANCSNVITTISEKIAVAGSHAHHLTNPYGIDFSVGCFNQALGCDISGQPEAADSWFMGFVWRYASCSQCHGHMGWYFSQSSGDNAFYGLILDNLQEDTN
ncbi:MAG: cereblon family protein [Pseudomonadota bacterium]|jgi:hypothetical protein|nr:cereblon family protein [Pseudomonadota bacterium]